MKDWSRIVDTRIEHGYNAASSLASARTAAVCSQCHSQKVKNTRHMSLRLKDDGSPEWYCTECGGTETLLGRITPENIKRRECKVAADMERFIEYAPVYEDLKHLFSACLRACSKLREDLAREFGKQEIESTKLSFHTHFSYFIQHHDPSKNWNKRRCSIPKKDIVKIDVNDSTYRECIQLLKYMDTDLTQEQIKLTSACVGRLKALRFPTGYVYEKIEYDSIESGSTSPQNT